MLETIPMWHCVRMMHGATFSEGLSHVDRQCIYTDWANKNLKSSLNRQHNILNIIYIDQMSSAYGYSQTKLLDNIVVTSCCAPILELR